MRSAFTTPHSLPWQQPNATEFTAARGVASTLDPLLNKRFCAYPWATWIDLSRNGSILESPRFEHVDVSIFATVCQHIWALEYLELFQRAGITDLFWSHATLGLTQIGGIRVHPFPLFPVRCATHPPSYPLLHPAKRHLLYSFQGSYTPHLYRTKVRDWIFQLPHRSDAQLEYRKEWHFEQSVYREQVHGEPSDVDRHAVLAFEADSYAITLQNSCFALCPSGSGPNSIRLWEALGYGAIPVILSDQLQLPGSFALWQDAVVVVPENPVAVAALPKYLEALASDLQSMEAMQQAGQILWRRYGINGLACDVIELLQSPLDFLRIRAQSNLPGIPMEITAESPAVLPLELRRCVRTVSQDQSLLIVIPDQAAPALLDVRWRSALTICSDFLGTRPWAVASVSPALESKFSAQSSRIN